VIKYKCLGVKSPGILFSEISMLQKIIAYPNGIIKYFYNDREVVELEDDLPIITIRTYNKKDIHGTFEVPNMVRSNLTKFSLD